MGLYPVYPADAELKQRESQALCEAQLKTWGRDLIPGNKISTKLLPQIRMHPAMLAPVCVHIRALYVMVSLLPGGGS